MVIYNVTTKVDWSIAKEWEQWMKQEHIPDVLATGCFVNHQFVRLLEVDEEEGPTYAAQYFATSKALYEEYIKQYASSFRNTINKKWGDKYIAFRTLMQLLD